MAGGIRSGYVMCDFPDGTSWKYGLTQAERAKAGTNAGVLSEEKRELNKKKDGTSSNKSPMAYVKEPIAKYFQIPIATPEKMQKVMLRTKSLTFEGEVHKTTSLATNMGATGASRSVTVKFKKLTNIGGKQVASVKIAMPYSYTVGNMVKFLLARPAVAANIAQIVSPSGKAMRYANTYKPKRK
jgi:hypothetical protein